MERLIPVDSAEDIPERLRGTLIRLVKWAGWDEAAAESHFLQLSPNFEIGSEIDFVASGAKRLRIQYPKIEVAPMVYRVEDSRLYLVPQ